MVRLMPCWVLLLWVSLGGREAEAQLASQLTYVFEEEQSAVSLVGNVGSDCGLAEQYPDEFPAMLFLVIETSQTVPGLFTVSTQGGLVRATRQVDRDEICPKLSLCLAQMNIQVLRQLEFFHIIQVTIEILDINDNPPSFPQASQLVSFPESSVVGSRVPLTPASDLDGPEYGIKRYQLVDQSNTFTLLVSNDTGGFEYAVYLVNHRALDREQQELYLVEVQAFDGTDNRGTTHSTAVQVSVQILDANDNSPIFESRSYDLTISESAPPFYILTELLATDRDSGVNSDIQYSIVEGSTPLPFDVNRTTGWLYTTAELDRELTPIYTFYVRAEDQGENSLPSTARVNIRVLDINDNPPRMSIQAPNTGTQIYIQETAPEKSFVALLTITDPDSGINGEFRCSLNSSEFLIEKLFDSDFKIVTAVLLDREVASEYNLQVSCEDEGEPSLTGVVSLHVNILDVNDNVPVFLKSIYLISVNEESDPPYPLLAVSATDADSGSNALIEYSINPDAQRNFSINRKTGEITALVPLDREEDDEVSLVVYAVDQGTALRNTATARVVVTITDINDQIPSFTPTSYTFVMMENQPAGSYVGRVKAVDNDLPPFNNFEYSLHQNGPLKVFHIDILTGDIIATFALDRETVSMYQLFAVAASTDGDAINSSVPVNIFVGDRNDNAPVFLFPSQYNNTVHISNRMRPGDHVTTMNATDEDLGANRLMQFSIYPLYNFTDIVAFVVDQVTGDVFVNASIRDFAEDIFSFRVLAIDQGSPKMTSEAVLNIIVNSTLPYENDLVSGVTLTAVVVIGCMSGLVAVVLILAIVVILIQQRKTLKKHRQLLLSTNVIITPRMRPSQSQQNLHKSTTPPPESTADDGAATIISSSNASDVCNTSFSNSSFLSDNNTELSNYSQTNSYHLRANKPKINFAVLSSSCRETALKPLAEVRPSSINTLKGGNNPACHKGQGCDSRICGGCSMQSDVTDSGRGSLEGDVTGAKMAPTVDKRGNARFNLDVEMSSTKDVISNQAPENITLTNHHFHGDRGEQQNIATIQEEPDKFVSRRNLSKPKSKASYV